jgi:MFS family permease
MKTVQTTDRITTPATAQSFYGWYLVAALWGMEFLNMGFPFYGGAVINTYMLHRIPMDRSTFGLGFTILNVFIGAPSVLIVASILRWGLRATFVIGSTFICAGALWMSFYATKPWHYLVGFGVLIGTGVGFGTIVPLSTGITRWFRRYRGRAMAIAFSASGFAGFIGAPLLNHILAANGGNFQQGWLIVACVALLAAVVAWLFIKESPEALGQYIDGLSPEAAAALPQATQHLSTQCAWTAGEAYRTPAFWCIILGAMACQFPFFFFNAHAILHMKGHGITAADAALAMGVFTGVGILGRFIGVCIHLRPRRLYRRFGAGDPCQRRCAAGVWRSRLLRLRFRLLLGGAQYHHRQLLRNRSVSKTQWNRDDQHRLHLRAGGRYRRQALRHLQELYANL